MFTTPVSFNSIMLLYLLLASNNLFIELSNILTVFIIIIIVGNNAVTYYELNSIYGHDTFLLDLNGVGAAVKVGHH